ncbi:MAG: fluoride efflux transporter CrcB [Gammaproteobacteria bacterium]|nr:fluoride efflux transporter CrcB [Gammaproteobacteria bacterium]
MLSVLAIALGGAAGSVLRYAASLGVYGLFGRGFPYGTLVVNVMGCLVMGFLYVWFVERSAVSAELRAGVLIGVLGGFTTFSSFSIETLGLIETGAHLRAALNVLASVVLCLVATWVGLVLARQVGVGAV